MFCKYKCVATAHADRAHRQHGRPHANHANDVADAIRAGDRLLSLFKFQTRAPRVRASRVQDKGMERGTKRQEPVG